MDLLMFILKHNIDFTIASTPLTIYFLNKKIFKIKLKVLFIIMIFILSQSIYYWIKIGGAAFILYQSIPYIVVFICLGSEFYVTKKKNDSGR